MRIWIDGQEVLGEIDPTAVPALATLPVDVGTQTVIEASNEHGYAVFQALRAARAGEPVPVTVLRQVQRVAQP